MAVPRELSRMTAVLGHSPAFSAGSRARPY